MTRDACALDLRQFIVWCEEHNLHLFGARRADIELRPRPRGPRLRSGNGRPPAVHGGALLPLRGAGGLARTVAGGPRASAAPGLRVHSTGLDHSKVRTLLVAAGLASAREHALMSLLAINGLRVSEALGADVEALAWSAAIAP